MSGKWRPETSTFQGNSSIPRCKLRCTSHSGSHLGQKLFFRHMASPSDLQLGTCLAMVSISSRNAGKKAPHADKPTESCQVADPRLAPAPLARPPPSLRLKLFSRRFASHNFFPLSSPLSPLNGKFPATWRFLPLSIDPPPPPLAFNFPDLCCVAPSRHIVSAPPHI